ncbi:heterokaryon incompatibility protein-domain-containing protein [Paraphoma chrysanthemicola]|uniref:Heterokaryon incompatibility protein-domain-containing protein n=1 Tax=Paraphoma chrysanthemicola TaxID=798071 RepID=A0A8K0VYI9_9PLEO|nr:heterokaryon incompatibility protein-domain-containing protein [Paraphoma chrysanthemicola]
MTKMSCDDIGLASASNQTSREVQDFAYRPLDPLQQSIRIIRVLPGDSSESIRCEIRHDTIHAEYSCLSYVWGQPTENHILIEGHLHSVRDNLFSFLKAAQRKPISKWLWIDALCIDQSNGVERTQQVRLMGLIFSHAAAVLSWLGDDNDIAEFLGRIPRGKEVTKSVAMAFFGSTYWLRAWIIQEIVLARRGILMASNVELAVKDLPKNVSIEESWNFMARTLRIWPDCYTSSHHGARDEVVIGRSLPWLLGRFRYKQCAIPRDRVFSFLGVCSDGKNITVDYETTKEEVAHDVISNCRQSFCLCSIGIVCEALDISIKPGSLPEWNYIPNERWQRIFAQFTLPVAWHDELSRVAKSTAVVATNNKKYKSHSASDFSDVQLCAKRRCGALARTPHVHCTTPDPSSNRILSVTFNLRAICDMIPGYMTIHIADGGAQYEYRTVQEATYAAQSAKSHYLKGHMYHSFSSDRKMCTVLLTLEMLLWIHKLSSHLHSVEDKACCQRLGNIGSSEPEPYMSQVLMLYEN